jgi:hypothetical protein
MPVRVDPPSTLPTDSSTKPETDPIESDTNDEPVSETSTTPDDSTGEENAEDDADQVAQAETPAASDLTEEEPTDSRLPLPSAVDRRQKLEQIEGLFAISDARTPAAKCDLADSLMETAQETREDDVARFVLFNLARELASAAGELETALAAVTPTLCASPVSTAQPKRRCQIQRDKQLSSRETNLSMTCSTATSTWKRRN